MTAPHALSATPALLAEDLSAQIEAAVFAAVDKCLGPFDQPLTLETRFADLGARSLELVSVAFELEDAYDIEIHQRSLNDFKTIGQAVQIVLALVTARGPRP